MPQPFTSQRTLAAAAVLALTIAACDLDVGEPQNPTLSRAEAEALAQVVAVDLATLPEGAVFDAGMGIPMAPPAMENPQPDCVSRSPDPAANSDGDAVPDSVRIEYTNCVFSRPTFTVEMNGIVDILDPNPTVADHSIKWVLTDLTRATTRLIANETMTTVQNGTRLVSASASVLEHQLIDFRTEVTFPNGSTASHEKNWATTFTADVAGSISPRQPLPSGNWVVNGTSSWSHGARSASLAVSTEVPLHYNAECSVAPKFDSGKLVLVMTRGDRTATVTIEYTACGQYTVTRS